MGYVTNVRKHITRRFDHATYTCPSSWDDDEAGFTYSVTDNYIGANPAWQFFHVAESNTPEIDKRDGRKINMNSAYFHITFCLQNMTSQAVAKVRIVLWYQDPYTTCTTFNFTDDIKTLLQRQANGKSHIFHDKIYSLGDIPQIANFNTVPASTGTDVPLQERTVKFRVNLRGFPQHYQGALYNDLCTNSPAVIMGIMCDQLNSGNGECFIDPNRSFYKLYWYG